MGKPRKMAAKASEILETSWRLNQALGRIISIAVPETLLGLERMMGQLRCPKRAFTLQ